MKLISKLLTTAVILSATSSFAYEDPNYYENEGDIIFKIRGVFSGTAAKLQKQPINTGKSKPKELFKNGYGIEGATTIFFDSHLATEISLGFQYYKMKTTELAKAAEAYGTAPTGANKKSEIYNIPLTGTMQYHLAPFGAVRPYVGAGYHGSYMYTRSKNFKTMTSHGPVIQFGIDFITMEDKVFNIDFKQYFTKSKIKFDKRLLGGTKSQSSKIKWNPLVISAGIGFRF